MLRPQTLREPASASLLYDFGRKKTGDERIELPLRVLETPVMPFDQSPISNVLYIYIIKSGGCQGKNYSVFSSSRPPLGSSFAQTSPFLNFHIISLVRLIFRGWAGASSLVNQPAVASSSVSSVIVSSPPFSVVVLGNFRRFFFPLFHFFSPLLDFSHIYNKFLMLFVGFFY